MRGNKMTETMVIEALRLRKMGKTYAEIGQELGIHQAKAWHYCNLERSRTNTRDSRERWNARGGVALCDVVEVQTSV